MRASSIPRPRKMRDTLIVVPCYNEEGRLDSSEFELFTATDSRTRFLFVDDGSTDHTGELLRKLCNGGDKSCAYVQKEVNQGKAEAVRHGIQAGLDGEIHFVGFWDADLSTPLEMIIEFRKLLEQEEHLVAAIGARVRLLGRKIERKAPRHYMGRFFATAASLVLGFPVYDTQCGAKLFRNTASVRRVFSTPFLSRWLFDVEILARLQEYSSDNEGVTVYEVPLPAWSDVSGSKVGFVGGLSSILDLCRIYWCYNVLDGPMSDVGSVPQNQT